jgi:hypothetical protein
MMAYVTETFATFPSNDNTQNVSGSWLEDFKRLIASLQLRSHEVTSLLTILAAAISTGKPMPPYLRAPPPVHLGQLLESTDDDILSTRHVPTTMLADDLEGLLEETKNLVGEVKFNVDVTGMRDLGSDADPVMMGEKGN